jgi:SAM-dependent methyltransferase
MVEPDRAIQLRVLETLESAKNFNSWVAGLARPYLGDHPLEIGSGLGYFARIFLDLGVPRITVSEMDDGGAAGLRSAFADEPRVEVEELDITAPPAELGGFSAVVALNVVEHIENDKAALAAMGRLVQQGGAVVVFVPAHAFAMSDFDRSIGHFRRYSKELLAGSFEEAGLSVEKIRHVNTPGIVAWYIGMKLLRRTPADQGLVRVYDRYVVPVTRKLEQKISLPFGQSLFAVGRP